MVAGSLKFETKLETKDFQKQVDKMSASTVAKGQLMANAFMKIGDTLKKVAMNGIQYNATIEQLTASFKTMTGSSTEAVKIVERLKKLGAETPYELVGLAETTQLLMQYGLNSEEAYKATMSFGDIAQGSAEKMQSIALAYGQMSSYGKVTLVDIKQMITAGFNPLQEISERTGESMSSLYDRISDGTLKVSEITTAMEKSSSEGGKFFKSMENQSKTLNGQMSTLRDNWDNFTGKIMSKFSEKLASDIIPKLNEFIGILSGELDNGQFHILSKDLVEVEAALIGLITTAGSFSIMLGLVTIVEKLKVSFLALHAVMLANPIILVISLIAGLVAGIMYLYNTSEEFREFWDNMWNGIVSYFQWQIDTVIAIFQILVDFFKEKINKIINDFNILRLGITTAINFLIEIFTNLPYYIGLAIGTILGTFLVFYQNIRKYFYEDVPNAVRFLIEEFKKMPERIKLVIDTIISFFQSLPGAIQNVFNSVISFVTYWINEIRTKMENGVRNIINNVISFFKELPENMINVGKNIVEGIWQGIVNAKDWMDKKVREFAQGILDGIKKQLGIHSPSTKARDLAEFIPEGVAIGIDLNTSSALNAVDKMNDSILSKMRNAVAKQTGFAGFAGISGNITEILNANSVIRVENYNTLELDGETIYENQQQISRNKNLQFAFGG